MTPERLQEILDLHFSMEVEHKDGTIAPPERVTMRAIGELLDEVNHLKCELCECRKACELLSKDIRILRDRIRAANQYAYAMTSEVQRLMKEAGKSVALDDWERVETEIMNRARGHTA